MIITPTTPEEAIQEAHHFQTRLIQSETRGEKIEITLLH
ncbi:PTS lactose/cellobiose transporter subunit IIA [Bacillus cereus]